MNLPTDQINYFTNLYNWFFSRKSHQNICDEFYLLNFIRALPNKNIIKGNVGGESKLSVVL